MAKPSQEISLLLVGLSDKNEPGTTFSKGSYFSRVCLYALEFCLEESIRIDSIQFKAEHSVRKARV